LPIANCQSSAKTGVACGAQRRAFAVAALVLSFAVSARGQTAGLDRSTIALGEAAALTIALSGNGPRAAPQPPDVPGLSITFSGQARQFQLINGRASSTVTLTYAVLGRQPGDYTIPSFPIESDGAKLMTPPVQIKVLPRGEKTPASAEMEKLAFVRLVSARKDCFIGEIFPIEVQLYFAAGRDVQLPNLRCEGFTVGKMVPEQTTVPLNGTYYNLVRFRSLVTPVKTGKLQLGPAECQLNIQLRAQDFFGFRLQQVSPQSEPVEINVLPLPEAGKPAGFGGAVGKYDLAYLATPTNVQVGDPITVKIQISGRGAIDQVALPPLDAWREFKTYPPSVKVDLFDPLSLMGAKNFEQVVMPQNAAIRELPPVSFSFFDPEAKAYRTLTQPAIPIRVQPGAGTQQPTVVLPGAQRVPGAAAVDIVHIKPHLGVLAPARAPLLVQPWFVAAQALPVLAWMALLVWRRRADALANNPRLLRQRAVEAAIAAGLDELRGHSAANRGAEFFSTTFRLLQERLGERLDAPAASITESVIEERLRPAGVADADLVALRGLFELCDRARFSGGQDCASLAVLVPKVETALERIKLLELK